MIDVLQEPAAKRAAHVVQASLVEVQIPINVQSDLKQWKQEVEDIKKKKGGHIHVRTDSNKVVIFAIPAARFAAGSCRTSIIFYFAAATIPAVPEKS
jgi:hypothetical protein